MGYLFKGCSLTETQQICAEQLTEIRLRKSLQSFTLKQKCCFNIFVECWCSVLWSITSIADYTAPQLSLKTDPASCGGIREQTLTTKSCHTAKSLSYSRIYSFFPPSAFDEKTCQRHFRGLVEKDSVGFMFSRSFCLNCGKLKSQVWTHRHRHQAFNTFDCRATADSNQASLQTPQDHPGKQWDLMLQPRECARFSWGKIKAYYILMIPTHKEKLSVICKLSKMLLLRKRSFHQLQVGED